MDSKRTLRRQNTSTQIYNSQTENVSRMNNDTKKTGILTQVATTEDYKHREKLRRTRIRGESFDNLSYLGRRHRKLKRVQFEKWKSEIQDSVPTV